MKEKEWGERKKKKKDRRGRGKNKKRRKKTKVEIIKKEMREIKKSLRAT